MTLKKKKKAVHIVIYVAVSASRKIGLEAEAASIISPNTCSSTRLRTAKENLYRFSLSVVGMGYIDMLES